MQDTILKKFQTDETILTILNKAQTKRLKRISVIIITTFCLAILLSLFSHFELFGWIISLLIAALISASLILNYKLSKQACVIGKIERIDHDYKLEDQKGTGGFGRLHSHIREKHNIVITIKSSNTTSQKIHSVVCPPQYEKILKLGDTILCHPYLNYPATLSNKSKCICVKCGTMQSSAKTVCYECGTSLFNVNT